MAESSARSVGVGRHNTPWPGTDAPQRCTAVVLPRNDTGSIADGSRDGCTLRQGQCRLKLIESSQVYQAGGRCDGGAWCCCPDSGGHGNSPHAWGKVLPAPHASFSAVDAVSVLAQDYVQEQPGCCCGCFIWRARTVLPGGGLRAGLRVTGVAHTLVLGTTARVVRPQIARCTHCASSNPATPNAMTPR